ncbi:MAG: hypothetical protein ABIR79_21695 [Candidatus Binatia bacterium]
MSATNARVGGGEMLAVIGLVALGTGLRFWHIDVGWFGVDQARDIQTGLDIAAGEAWPTVGPTMRRLTSLGALYYYFWALPHLVSADPLAAYRFAAGLGVATLVAAWAFARRFWGVAAGLVTLAALATAPVAVIDARVAWAPAALPIVAVGILWLLVGPLTSFRLGLLGALLGLAVQLHLSMVAWGATACVVVLVRRPRVGALAAGVVGCALVGFPALYAAAITAGNDAGLQTLPSRGPIPDIVTRIGAALALQWRVPSAFWQWSDAPDAWGAVARAAAMIVTATSVVGLARLAAAAVRGRRAAAVVGLALLVQLAMVALLPGEAWYYYLDAALPLWALAAGALFATSRVAGRWPVAGAVIVVAATLVLGAHLASWIAVGARHGYVALNPAALSLDGAGGRDAPVAGRLVTAGVKRALAAALADEPALLATRWLAVHGPAFDDATGDNGFWLAQHASESSASPAATPVSSPRHVVLWYREDPTAPTVPTDDVALVSVGPLIVARYHPTIDYAGCHDEHGPVPLPARVVPSPRRYGDGTIARPATLPTRVDCTLAPGVGGARIVAAMSAGTVTLHAAGATGATAATSTLCVRRGDVPTPFTIETALPAGAVSDLDLYERPDPECGPAKIAP